MSAEKKIEEIKQYLEKMTSGPWEATCGRTLVYVNATDCRIYKVELDPQCIKDTHDRQKRDAKGIAALRTDAEWLLQHVAELRGALQELVLATYGHDKPNALRRAERVMKGGE